jgi:hypothetical protein
MSLNRFHSVCAATACAFLALPAAAQAPAATAPSYADLADLADPAVAVIHARIRKQATVEPERAPGLAPGHVRLYLEAETVALLTGSAPIGGALRYLVDLPLDEKGRAPKLKKRDVLLFTRAASGRPGEIALVAPDAQLDWSPELEARLRPILAELADPDAPVAVTTVREALSVPGNLVGESETQFFVGTEGAGPLSITVVHRPNMAPVWGVSRSEIVDQAAEPPRPDTLGWYRLACFLPRDLPREANLTADAGARARAMADYRFVRDQLGPCPRNRS